MVDTVRQVVSRVLVAGGFVQDPKVREAITASNQCSDKVRERLDRLEDKIGKDC